jgi:hypothetical protein
MIYRIFSLISFVLLSWSLSAQQEARLDHVFLLGGNFLQGMVVDTVNDEYLQLQLGGDSLLLIPLNLVEKVKTGKRSVWRSPIGHSAQSDGFFFELAGQVLSAESSSSWTDEWRTNISLQFNGGYFLRSWLSLGAGLSVDRYEEVVVPIFTQLRLYVPERATAPYLGFQFGHGIAVEKLFNREEYDKSRGGWMWYPSVGIRLASRNQADFHFDLGYKFQQLTKEYDYPDDWWTTNVKESLTYKSFALRLGCTF